MELAASKVSRPEAVGFGSANCCRVVLFQRDGNRSECSQSDDGGWPLSGIANLNLHVESEVAIRWIDIDEVVSIFAQMLSLYNSYKTRNLTRASFDVD